jgi:hypothetical protein
MQPLAFPPLEDLDSGIIGIDSNNDGSVQALQLHPSSLLNQL